MTRADLAAINASIHRLELVIRAIKAFDACRTERDFARAERDLKAALRSEPSPATAASDRTQLPP